MSHLFVCIQVVDTTMLMVLRVYPQNPSRANVQGVGWLYEGLSYLELIGSSCVVITSFKVFSVTSVLVSLTLF